MTNRATTLLAYMEDQDADWLLAAGSEQRIPTGEAVIHAGQPPQALMIVLEGLLGVFSSESTRERLAVLGAGEMIGDMTLIEKRPPGESVIAIEESLLYVLPHTILEQRFNADPAFASRFYHSVALTLSRRLRRANSMLKAERITAAAPPVEGAWQSMREAVDQIKERLHVADSAALKNFGQLPEPVAQQLNQELQQFYMFIGDQIGDASFENVRIKEEIGAYVQKEFLPYIALTETLERLYTKPRGYPGDFLTIQKLCSKIPGGVGRLGPAIDRSFLFSPPAAALSGRFPLMAQEIMRTIQDAGSGPAWVTSMGCGPAMEVFEAFNALEDPNRLQATLIDFDLQTLAYISEKRDRANLQRNLNLVNENLIYLALGRSRTDILDQDLIYSTTLIDYYTDYLLVKLLNLAHSLLRPGGRIVLNCFHPRNRYKAFMDYVLEWRLTHRTEEEMNSLFERSAFGQPCSRIQIDEQGINMLVEGVKKV